MYSVAGVTTETGSGHQRKLSGTIILAEEGPRYTATFSLTTTYPGGDQSLPGGGDRQGRGDASRAARSRAPATRSSW